MYNGNAVYNFEMFQEKIENQKAQIFNLPDLNSRNKKKQKAKLRFYLSCFSLVLTSGITLGAFLFGQAKLVEYNSQIAISASELEEIKSKNEQLEIKLSALNSVSKDTQEEKCVEIITVAAGDKAEIK